MKKKKEKKMKKKKNDDNDDGGNDLDSSIQKPSSTTTPSLPLMKKSYVYDVEGNIHEVDCQMPILFRRSLHEKLRKVDDAVSKYVSKSYSSLDDDEKLKKKEEMKKKIVFKEQRVFDADLVLRFMTAVLVKGPNASPRAMLRLAGKYHHLFYQLYNNKKQFQKKW
jgi:hypothetical protein